MTEIVLAPFAEYGRAVRVPRSMIADAFSEAAQEVVREFLRRRALEVECMVLDTVRPRGWGNPEIRSL